MAAPTPRPRDLDAVPAQEMSNSVGVPSCTEFDEPFLGPAQHGQPPLRVVGREKAAALPLKGEQLVVRSRQRRPCGRGAGKRVSRSAGGTARLGHLRTAGRQRCQRPGRGSFPQSCRETPEQDGGLLDAPRGD